MSRELAAGSRRTAQVAAAGGRQQQREMKQKSEERPRLDENSRDESRACGPMGRRAPTAKEYPGSGVGVGVGVE